MIILHSFKYHVVSTFPDILEAAEVRRIRKLAGTKATIRAKAKNSLPPKSIVLNEHVNIVPGDLHIKFSQLDMGGILGQGKNVSKTKSLPKVNSSYWKVKSSYLIKFVFY